MPDLISWSGRAVAPLAYYEAAMASFDAARVRFLVLADNLPRARALLAPLRAARGLDLVFVDENVVVALALMARCTHHILASSTLSFWGAYLDPRQPRGGRTLLPACFFAAHTRAIIPYPEWEVVPANATAPPRARK